MPATEHSVGRRLVWAAAAVLTFTGLIVLFSALFDRTGPPAPTRTGTVTSSPPSMTPLPRSEPVRIKVPAIGVDAPVVPVGLDAQGVLIAPPLSAHNLTGWFRYGASPGQLGPAVIEGHVDSKSGPSVFYSLGRLASGARIEVIRQDGTHVVFQVDTLEQVAKTAFPTQRVYGALSYSALRLITCGGTFDRTVGSYRDNIIVYAHRVPT